MKNKRKELVIFILIAVLISSMVGMMLNTQNRISIAEERSNSQTIISEKLNKEIKNLRLQNANMQKTLSVANIKILQLQKQNKILTAKNGLLIRANKKLKKKITLSKDLKTVLYKVAAIEAGYGKKKAIKNIVYVILNRVHSKKFPNTIRKVLYAHNQFTPVQDGSYVHAMVNKQVRDAVNEAVSDYRPNKSAQGALYFKSMHNQQNWGCPLFTDGRNKFYSHC